MFRKKRYGNIIEAQQREVMSFKIDVNTSMLIQYVEANALLNSDCILSIITLL